MRIFRNLLIAAANAIKEFLAFAAPECFQSSLINITNNGCTDLGDGLYSASSGTYMQTKNLFNLTDANSWEVKITYTYKGGGSEPMVWASGPADFCGAIFLVRSGALKLYLRTSSSQDWQVPDIPMGITMVNNEIYHFKLGYNTNDGFYLDYYTESGTHSYTRVWNNTDSNGNPISGKIYSNNHCQFLNWGLNYSNYYSAGTIDFKETSITVDGSTTYFSSFPPEVHDNINLNDGMATSNYDWSAYPIGVKNGTYTQTGTVEQIKEVSGNTVYVTQEPQQDNKDVSIKAGQVYYAYTNENDNTDTLYTTDSPISKGYWENPLLDANGTLGGDNPACYASHADSMNPAWHAFDGDTTTGENCWWSGLMNGLPCYLTYYTQNPIQLKSIFIMNELASPANFKDATIQGSNDNTNWTDLYSITNWTNGTGYSETISINSNTDYKYFRLYFTAYYGDSVSLQEVKLFGYDSSNISILYENTGTTEFTPVALDPQPEFEVGTGIIASDLQNGAIVIPVKEITSSLEMVIHFKTGSSWPNYCLCDSSKDGTERNPSVYFQNYDSYLVGWFYSANYTSGNADIANDWNTYFQPSLNSEYWFKLTWDGTYYRTYSSTDGISYTVTNYHASSTPINWANNYLYLGNNYDTSVSDVYQNIYLNGTYIKVDGETIFDGSTAVEGVDFTNTGCTLIGFASNTIKIGNNFYKLNNSKDEVKDIPGLNIDTVDNTTIQTVTIISDQTATIETSANITTSNNDNVITDDSYKLFNLTIPTGMTAIIESMGISYQSANMPLLLKKNSGVGFLLKDGNNSYYRNSWTIIRDYDLHYQQINFSYPSGATVMCKVNNVAQSNLTPYVYCGDTVTWTCDNSGTVTTGSYTVKYSSKDGNIQTITIS